jgi:hypothetical protein
VREPAIASVQVTILQCPPRKRAQHKDWFSIGPQQVIGPADVILSLYIVQYSRVLTADGGMTTSACEIS